MTSPPRVIGPVKLIPEPADATGGGVVTGVGGMAGGFVGRAVLRGVLAAALDGGGPGATLWPQPT